MNTRDFRASMKRIHPDATGTNQYINAISELVRSRRAMLKRRKHCGCGRPISKSNERCGMCYRRERFGRALALIGCLLLCFLPAPAQLSSPRATPTGDKPMAKAAPDPKALAVVPTPVPTPGLIVRKLSWNPVPQAIRYDLKWYPHIGDESTGTDPYYDWSDYIQIPTNSYSLSLTGSPPWKLELQSINVAGVASTNVTIIFWDQLTLDYYRQVADSVAGPWREDAQPFSTATNPVGMGVTRIRVGQRRL